MGEIFRPPGMVPSRNPGPRRFPLGNLVRAFSNTIRTTRRRRRNASRRASRSFWTNHTWPGSRRRWNKKLVTVEDIERGTSRANLRMRNAGWQVSSTRPNLVPTAKIEAREPWFRQVQSRWWRANDPGIHRAAQERRHLLPLNQAAVKSDRRDRAAGQTEVMIDWYAGITALHGDAASKASATRWDPGVRVLT